jgi:hypothetical protein
MLVCIELTFTTDGFRGLWNLNCRPARFLMVRRAFMLKSRMSHPEYTNGVIVFVAGFFGLHA